jgi:hypothetical protein
MKAQPQGKKTREQQLREPGQSGHNPRQHGKAEKKQ